MEVQFTQMMSIQIYVLMCSNQSPIIMAIVNLFKLNDLNNNNISDVNLYLNVKDKFSNLGKTSIELLEIYKFN